MRIVALAVASLALMVSAGAAQAQTRERDRQDGRDTSANGQQEANGGQSSAPRVAPLGGRINAGPCPYVKILYEGARYVELTDNRPSAANVGYTGEIEGLSADCSYGNDTPITVDVNILFNLGRGPQATADQRTYRYWIAVTERNKAVLAKEYFELPVNFDGGQTASITEGQRIVIPRAESTTSGDNFEVLVGFEVTPEMAEFNRTGSRFRVNAGVQTATPPPAQ